MKEQNLCKPWQPGQSGNPKGRPKNRVIQEWLPNALGKDRARKIKDLSRDEINTWERRLIVAGSDDLTAIAKSADAPIYAKNLAMAILYDTKNGKTATIDKLRDRQYGMPAKRIELTGADGSPLMPPSSMTQEEARDFIKQLEEDY